MSMAENRAAAPDDALGWLGGRSRWIDLDGPVHYLDFGGPAEGPVIVCVHGLGGSAVNWSAIAPLLTGRCRLLAPDLAGHGLTRSAGRGVGVAANRILLHRFLASAAVSAARHPVILMGNSMGGMISLLEASAAPSAVTGLILIDPALPIAAARPDPVVAATFAMYLTPGLSRLMMNRRREASPEAQVAGTLSLCCADPSRIPAEVVARHVEVARRRAAFTEGGADFAAAMRSVMTTIGRGRGQVYRRAIASVSCPVLLLHGDRDRLVPVAVALAAARANPSWSLAVLPGVGHVPQLEAPRDCARVITGWLDSAGRRAAQSAARLRQ
jgi:pimeloyl-ACP methyl ester carboxylesterase